MGFRLDLIGNNVQRVKSWSPAKEIPNEKISYIDLSSIDKDSKTLLSEFVQEIPSKDAPSRAKQKVLLNDILVSTVRPNLNGVCIVDKEYPNGTASTGYCVLRAKESLDTKYLFYWVQTKNFVGDMTRKATGASYPAVSDRIVKESKIPLPPLPQQKKIAAILDAADAYRQKTKALIGKYEELGQSLFLDMFGDPVRNEKGWEVKKLEDISTKILSGNTPKGGSNVYVEKGILFFRSQNVWRNRLALDDVAYIDKETHDKMRKSSIKNRDILMTKTGRFNTPNSSLGRAAMFLGEDDTANVNGHVYLIRLQEGIINEFVLFILTTNEYREYIRRVCVGGIDKRQINKTHLEEFPIISPPITLQNQFVERLQTIESQKSKAQVCLAKAEDLFNSLLQKAFKGELTNG